MSSLNGSWIEIFRAGDYGERGQWSAEDLDRIAAAYNPRLHPAPVVVGHPQNDAPAYGWIARLRRAGQSLWAQLEKVDAGFEKLLREGRFRQRSVALYKNFPPVGAPYLRHVGFLGAQAPAVKGLAPVRFAGAPTVSFTEAISFPEAAMSQSKTEKLFEYLRAFFSADQGSSRAPGAFAGEDGGSATPVSPSSSPGARSVEPALEGARPEALSKDGGNPLPSSSEAEPELNVFAGRLHKLEQRLEIISVEKTTAEKKLTAAEVTSRKAGVASFTETLRARGQFPPAFDRLGVVEFLERLAAVDHTFAEAGTGIVGRGFNPAENNAASAASTEGFQGNPSLGSPEQVQPTGMLAWFQEFLAQLPRVIDFRELAVPCAPAGTTAPTSSSPATRVVPFTEPRRGMEVDLASVELAERAEAFAAEHGVTYAEALTQLRQQHNYQHTSV